MGSPSQSNQFQRKVYKKLDSSPLSQTIPPPTHSHSEKKIIPSRATRGLREEFKKIFLPLLIDSFELRQTIDNQKSEKGSSSPLMEKSACKSPKEILKRLEQMQADILEAQRWCDGVILQIAKGIEEAKKALILLEEGEKEQEKPNLLKRLLKIGRK